MFDSFFDVFGKSLSGFKFYPSLLLWPTKRIIGYFLSLAGALTFIAIWIQLPVLILGLTEVSDWAVRKLPDMRFEKGVLKIIEGQQKSYNFPLDKDFPFLGKDFALIIDPTNEKKDDELKAGFLFREKQMLLRGGQNNRIVPYPQNLSITVSSFTLMQWRDILYWVMPLFFWLQSFLNLVLAKGFEVLFWGSVGFIFVRLLRKNLPWRACLHIAVVSITPALIIALLASFVVFLIPYFGLIYYSVYLFSFYGALKACLGSAVATEVQG